MLNNPLIKISMGVFVLQGILSPVATRYSGYLIIWFFGLLIVLAIIGALQNSSTASSIKSEYPELYKKHRFPQLDLDGKWQIDLDAINPEEIKSEQLRNEIRLIKKMRALFLINIVLLLLDVGWLFLLA